MVRISLANKLLPRRVKGLLLNMRDQFLHRRSWASRGYSLPAPRKIKNATLVRHGHHGGIWIETGTHLGQTTEFISGFANHVFTIEPSANLFEKAQKRLSKCQNVTTILGTSEEQLPTLLERLSEKQSKLTCWLDGHYSGGETFQGRVDTPIKQELKSIAEFKHSFSSVIILVDDVRCFEPQNPIYSSYPDLDWLVDWCRSNNFTWNIEFDIFIAKWFQH